MIFKVGNYVRHRTFGYAIVVGTHGTQATVVLMGHKMPMNVRSNQLAKVSVEEYARAVATKALGIR